MTGVPGYEQNRSVRDRDADARHNHGGSGHSGAGLRMRVPRGVLALQRAAGNAAVGRVLARQAADTDVKSSRRSVVIWEKPPKGKRVKLGSKLVVRAQIPKGSSDTLDSIVGQTEAENARKKARSLETEFIALDGDIWKITPEAFQRRMKELGVKATIEFEPFDAKVTDTGAGKFELPSIDVMKVNIKLEWFVGQAVFELEVSGSLSPMSVLGAADRKLLEKFEGKVKALRTQMLELEQDKARLAAAQKRTADADKALDAARRRVADAETAAKDKLTSATRDLEKVRNERRAADAAVDAARKRRDDALKKLDRRSWDEFKKQSTEIAEKSKAEIAELQKKALKAKATEREAERAFKKAAGEASPFKPKVVDKGVKEATERLAESRAVEKQIAEKIERRKGTIKKLGQEAVDLAKKGKSWVFKKIVGPRMIKVLGLLAKAIPILNVLSLAADLYEIGKLLWNWDKLKFGFGGGDGGAGGNGSGGKPDPSGKGSGSGGTGQSPTPAQGGGSGTDPWDPDTPLPPTSGQTTGGTTAKPDPAGTSKTGSGTKATGSGSGAPPPVPSGKAGGQQGAGNDPAGTSDQPGGTGTAGTGTGTGKTGGGTKGGGSSGGADAGKKPGAGGAKGGGTAKGKGTPAKLGGTGKGNEPAVKQDKKQRAPALIHVRAIPINQAAGTDIDLFASGATVQIAKFTGLDKWTAGKGGYKTDVVSLTVKHDGQAYRVSGVPIAVVSRTEDLPPKTAGEDEYFIAIDMEITKTLRLQGTNLVINKGDALHYQWEGSY